MTDFSKFLKVRFGDVVEIYTPTSFKQKKSILGNQSYIYVPKTFCAMQTKFAWREDEDLMDGYAVVSKYKEIDLLYIFTIMNSIGFQIYLNCGVLFKKVNLTLKKLMGVPFVITNSEYQEVIFSLEVLIVQIQDSINSHKADAFAGFRGSLFKEVRDYISIQMLTIDILKELDIDVFGAWVDLFNNFWEERNFMCSLEEAQEQIVRMLLEPENMVMTELKKMRLVIEQISNSLL